MTKSEIAEMVRNKLNKDEFISETVISDIITTVLTYCNIHEQNIPEGIEPIIRRKVVAASNYIKNHGGMIPTAELSSIHEGDGTLTFATGASNSYDAIFGLSDVDKAQLRAFRRLRGYV